jgi:hypothetical protein
MRQIDRDDTPGLGEPLPRQQPADTRPEWEPTGTQGIERHRGTGQLRNVTPPPPSAAVPYIGTPQTWGRAIESLRRECWRQRSQ